MAHVADRQAHHPRSENVARDNGFSAYRGLATHRLYPTDFLEKIKRLLVVCSSICIARAGVGGGGGNLGISVTHKQVGTKMSTTGWFFY